MTAYLQRNLELVRAGIDRIKRAEAHWQRLQVIAGTTSAQNVAAHRACVAASNELGRQWRDIETLLDALTQGQSSEVKPTA